MSIAAVRIKLNSIQEYIFTSNKLSENIGASNITDQLVFRQTMTKVLEEIFENGFNYDFDEIALNGNLQKDNYNLFAASSSQYVYYVLDIGGGGAIVLLNENATSLTNSTRFIQIFSKKLLLEYPGLKYSISMMPAFDINDIKNRNQTKELNDLKNKYYLVSNIPKHGLTQDCPLNNDAAEIFNTTNSKFKNLIAHKHKGISKSASVKLLESEMVHLDIINLLKSYNLIFSDDLSKLGQNKEGSYIAVVHIDGNGVGEFINGANTGFDFGAKSIAAQACAKNAIMKLLQEDICKNIRNGKVADEIELEFSGSQYIIPFRPLLSGGDDITFVCEGRLGMYLAEKFIEYYTDNKSIIKSACAGVAIVKTKFPFYKAYKLAEELCSEAKAKARNDGNMSSYISYYYAADSFAGSLEQIRERTQVYKDIKLYQGPYNLSNSITDNSLSKLKSGIKNFKDGINISNNKIQKLRELLIGSNSAKKVFIARLKELEYQLPDEIMDDLIDNPRKLDKYFDQIELMDFYLKTLW